MVSMLKDYSDYFDAMTTAAAVTGDTFMQPFVAWYAKASLAWAATKSSSIESVLKYKEVSVINLANFGITSPACCALAEVLVLNVARHTSHITHHTSHVTHHTSHITHHTSHITHHITHHTSHITHPLSHPPPTQVLLLLPPSSLSSLNLSVNTIGDLGASALAFAADVSTALTSLNLSTSKITSPGAAAIASALSASRGSREPPTRAAIGQLQPVASRVPVAQVCELADVHHAVLSSATVHGGTRVWD